MRKTSLKAPWALGLIACAVQIQAAPVEVAALRNLADLSLEQLGNIEVTSVSGRSESLQGAAASIYVITAQDIRRSAAISLPEVLRLAPNLQVAQASAGSYAISARGFNNPLANKLLVLVDGRTVYSTLFSGVFWDATKVPLEDVERIEVISGPGGTLWGANAVNGVINVITRSAADTQGALGAVTRSTHGGREVARWGTRLSEAGHLRVYGLATDRDNTELASGAERPDASTFYQAGFRADWEWGPSALTFQGDVYRGGDSPANNLASDLHGGNLLARWSSRFADGSPYKVQAYYDLADRDDSNAFRNRAETVDLQFTHEPKVGTGQLLWGAGYRRGRDVSDATALVLFNPAERLLSWGNVFAQHQVKLRERWQLTTGVKFERNTYTGVEVLPNVRLAYLHSPQATTWASASRTVRAPARIDREFFFPGRAPFFIAGGPNFQSETANVFELGHRGQAGSRLSYSVTAFRQYYKGLRAGIPGQVPATVENQIEGPADGVEAWGQWQATNDWRLSAGYTHLRKRLRFTSGATDLTSIPNLGNDPRHQWQLRSSLNLGRRTEFDVMVRRVGALPAPLIPSYTAVDARLALQVSPSLRIALLGQNLLDKRHVEFEAPATASQLPRRWYLQATWQL
jgi:iron complex outermembrane receptor protein